MSGMRDHHTRRHARAASPCKASVAFDVAIPATCMTIKPSCGAPCICWLLGPLLRWRVERRTRRPGARGGIEPKQGNPNEAFTLVNSCVSGSSCSGGCDRGGWLRHGECDLARRSGSRLSERHHGGGGNTRVHPGLHGWLDLVRCHRRRHARLDRRRLSAIPVSGPARSGSCLRRAYRHSDRDLCTGNLLGELLP